MLTKKKEKRSKKERKNDTSKDKILGVSNPLRSKYFVFAGEENSTIFCKLFSGRDIVNRQSSIV
jgi:hypothetical protein